MRVVIFHDFLIERGGGERVVFAILKSCRKNVKIFSSLYIPSKTYESFSSKNIISVDPLISTMLSKFSLIKSLFTIFFFGVLLKRYRTIIEKKFDIAIFSGFYSICLAPFLNIPKIYYINSEPFQEAMKRKKYSIISKLFEKLVEVYNRIERKCLNSMDLIIANSNYTKRLYQSYGFKVNKVIYPPVDTKRFKNCHKNEGKYFLFVGRLLPHKRPDIPLKVFAKIKNEKLVIVGDGPLRKLVKYYSKKFANISYLGSVSDQKLKKLYSGCKAVIYLTEKEPFGIVPIEANSCGKPAIVSNEGGLPETIIDGKTGLVLKPDYENNLLRVLKNFNKYKFSLEACKRNAKKFDTNSFVRELTRTISKIKRD
jgi:glycosyltransferase involved in cell wall biosynthesis